MRAESWRRGEGPSRVPSTPSGGPEGHAKATKRPPRATGRRHTSPPLPRRVSRVPSKASEGAGRQPSATPRSEDSRTSARVHLGGTEGCPGSSAREHPALFRVQLVSLRPEVGEGFLQVRCVGACERTLDHDVVDVRLSVAAKLLGWYLRNELGEGRPRILEAEGHSSETIGHPMRRCLRCCGVP